MAAPRLVPAIRRRATPSTSGVLELRRRAAAHDVDRGAVGDQAGRQRRRERGDPARRRREGRQDPERSDGRSPRRCGGSGPERRCARRAPVIGSVEATGLRRATEPRRPSSPSEAHSSKRMCGHPTGRRFANRRRYPAPHPALADTAPTPARRCGSPCSRRSPGGRRRATTGRGSSSPRCSPRASSQRGHDVTLFATADSVTTATLHGTAPRGLVGGRRRSTRRSPSACTSPRCSSAPTSSTSSTTASTSCRSPTAGSSTRRS